MGYQKNNNDNGRVTGAYESVTTEHIIGKTEYFKRDQSGNDKSAEDYREWNEELNVIENPKNDTKEIIEVTEDDNKDEV